MNFKGKILRRAIVILLVFWLVLLSLLYFSSGKYRDHAIAILKTQLDKNLLTKIQIRKDDIQVSLLRQFPNAVINLGNILVESAPGLNYAEFNIPEKDTLLYAENVALVLDLRSFLTHQFVLKQIVIENAQLNILYDSEGLFNYNIWRAPVEGDSSQVEVDLKKIKLENVKLQYIDNKANVAYSSYYKNAELSGNYSGEDFRFDTYVEAVRSKLKVDKQVFEDHKLMTVNGEIRREKGTYTFSDVDFTLYGIKCHGKGKYVKTDGSFNFACNSNSASLQKADKSVFSIYKKELDFHPRRGQLSLDASFSGNSKIRTAIDLQYKIEKGVFTSKESGLKIEDVYIEGGYTNGKYRNSVSSQIEIDTFYCSSDKSHLSASGVFKNFQSPEIRGNLSVNLQIEKLLSVKKIAEKFEMNGNIQGDIFINGKLPSSKNIKPQELKKVKLMGAIVLDNVYLKPLQDPLPEATISGSISLKNLMEVDLREIRLLTGNSKLVVNGSVTNLPLFSDQQTYYPVYRCKIEAEEFHVEDFIVSNQQSTDEPLNVEFPDSVILYADVNMEAFHFGKFNAKQVKGHLQYTPKRLLVSNFSMKSQGGEIASDLTIQQANKMIITTANANFTGVDMGDLFFAFNEFNQDVITHEYIDGRFSGNADVRVAWDLALNPLYDEIQLRSEITIEKGELINYQPLMGLSDFIEVEELKHIKFDRLETNINIVDENVNISQTEINSSAISLLISGDHNFKNEYTYLFEVQLADVLWKKAKKQKPQNTEFGYVVDDGLGRTTLPLQITGKDTEFTVSYDKKTAGSAFRQKVKAEKKEWRNLIQNKEDAKEDEIRLDWEDSDETLDDPADEIANDDEEEFIIDWEDE